VTRPPDFDALVGSEVDADERERLRRVHELLVTAGPPPELSPQIEAGPTLAMTLSRPRGRGRRRVLLLAAALVLVVLAFLGGYIVGNGGGGGLSSGRTLRLAGTAAAPTAQAALRIGPVDSAGNRPMDLSATGLAKLPPHGYYAVFLVRNGKPLLPCGSFVVAGTSGGVLVHLNAPYHLRPGDSWVVTRQLPGHHDPGAAVLRPTA